MNQGSSQQPPTTTGTTSISVSPDGNKKSKKTTIYSGDKAFKQLWQKVNKTMSEVWNSKTIADFVEFERNSNATGILNYVI